jgi:uncharacterized protein (TIGR00251 family)
MASWLKKHPQGTVLLLYICPGSSLSALVGTHGERLKVKIAAPPCEGEANLVLRKFMAELLGLAKGQVHLLRGESSRNKDVLVELSPEEVTTWLKVPD